MFVLDLTSLAPDSLHPFSRADYERLVELGLFRDAHVELLRGAVVTMSPQGPWHAVVAARVHEVLLRVLAGRVFVMSHSPLPLSSNSEPEPDVAVYPPGATVDALPTDPLLVVEVSDSSLPKDQGLKRDLYAEAGVLEYWVVSKADEAVEVYTQPRDGVYRSRAVYGRKALIRPTAFGDVAISVAEFLGEG